MKNNKTAFMLVALLLSIVSGIHSNAFAQNQSAPRLIEITADKDNTFKVPGAAKPVITLKPGEKVTLRITAHFGGQRSRDNYVHSFVIKKLRSQGWDLRLKEGTEDYALVAPQSTGDYVVECTVMCGPGHEYMNMKVVVQN